ncbi:MAG TPA: hypothetical protein VGM86_17695 [Thermoanaerobaculia bacterium]|jgi:hypothetical protein
MSKIALKRSLKLVAVLVLTLTATSTRKAGAANCAGDPAFFCDCARAAAQLCWSQYQACGGFMVDGCWDTYSQCELDSGIDSCQ